MASSLSDFFRLLGAFNAQVFSLHPPREESERIEGLDLHVYGYSAVLVFVIVQTVNRLLLFPLAARVLPKKNRAKTIPKFVLSATEAYMYSFFFYASLRVLYTQPWIWPSRMWWEGKQNSTSHLMVTPSVKFMYQLYGGRYVSNLVHVLIEPRKKDFVEMVLHHATTALLCPLSYSYGYVRVGAAVMLLLDPADPPLHIAKLCRYMAGGNNSSRWQTICDHMFNLFGVTFVVTRNVMYPYIVWSAWVEAKRYIDNRGDPTAIFGVYLLDEFIAILLLTVLLFLQYFWLYLIIKVALKPNAHDNRESSDEEGADKEKSPIARKKEKKQQ